MAHSREAWQECFEGVEYVHVECLDLNGIARGFLADIDHYKKNEKSGFGMIGHHLQLDFKGNQIEYEGEDRKNVIYNNGTIFPDPSTFVKNGWNPKIANVISNFQMNDDSYLQSCCPRSVCQNQVKRLEDAGYKYLSSFEYEFQLLKDRKIPNVSLNLDYCIDTHKMFEPVAIDIMKNMKMMGLKPERFLHEHRTALLEITMNATFGISGADQGYRFKQIVKDVSKLHDYQATFMTKPNSVDVAQEGHNNHSLWDSTGQVNLFSDVTREDKLSDLARFWIGGLRHHAQALSAFCSPTTNCDPSHEAGTLWCISTNHWGFDNRTAAFRVKTASPKATFVENRMSSSCANSYLLTAATIIAGLDGIKRKLEPGEPTSINALYLDESTYQKIPAKLEDRLQALEKNSLFKEHLGERLVSNFVALKRVEIYEMFRAKCVGKLTEWFDEYYMDNC